MPSTAVHLKVCLFIFLAQLDTGAEGLLLTYLKSFPCPCLDLQIEASGDHFLTYG